MIKNTHEIRDPIHVFIRLDSDERRVLDSSPLQRLRNVHQLAMSYLVYPGATHNRLEHSLGAMELASQIFDVVTSDENIHSSVKEILPELGSKTSLPTGNESSAWLPCATTLDTFRFHMLQRRNCYQRVGVMKS